jgi:hypothetical protein
VARDYAYASAPDVAAHLTFMPSQFTATSQPKATQVHNFLLDTAQEIDTALAGQGYQTPIPTTATQAIQQANAWNSVGAAMFTVYAMPQGGGEKHGAFLERRWTAILADIRDGNVKLPDAGTDTTVGLARHGGQATARFTVDDEP